MNKSQQMIQEISRARAGFADGYVIHNRKHPRRHRFKYNMCWCLFDIDHFEQWTEASRLWRLNKWSIFSLYNRDYIDTEELPIKVKICRYLEQQSGQSFDGEVFLLTHPRFLGYSFNSVNFYFCYQDNGLVYIVSEITNTPWGEKHLYFHNCALGKKKNAYTFEFDKEFHISPFLSMDMNYQWTFTVNPDSIKVTMFVHKDGVNLLNVFLDTKITPVMENNINRYALRKPFQPWKMSMGIYWQAFKIWLKKIPVHSHPKN